MSSARTRRTQTLPPRHSRRDVVVAVLVGTGIVVVTALLVWLMRPGDGGPGTGGLFNRQPRATLLVFLALAAFGLAAWWILRPGSRWRSRAAVALPVAGGVIVVGSIVAGFVWPGGLLRHPEPVPDLEELQRQFNEGASTTTAAPEPSTSTAPASTTTASTGSP
jgi:hypothetical protein